MLSVNNVRASRETGGYRLSAVLEQTQPEPAYLLEIPVAVQLEGQKQAWQTTVRMERKRLDLNLELPARPWRLFVDPEFDVMRRLARREIPPALSQILGAERVLVVLPATAPSELRKAYQAIARSWAASNDAIQATWDTEITQLPTGQAVWLFGWENHHRSQLAAALAPQHVTITDSGVTLDKRMLSRDENGMVLVARHPGNAELPIAWLAYDRAEGLPGLARKIPHYGTYSCLAFTGNAPDNVLKEQWPVTDSPLWTTVIQSDGAAAPDSRPSFAPRTPLGQPPHKQAEADKPERGGTRFH